MEQYLDLLVNIKEKGVKKSAARDNMPGTTSLFGYQFRHDLSKGFPLLTTKELSFSHIITELLWFLRGDANVKYLIDNGCNIWNEDAYKYYVKLVSGNSENWNPVMKNNSDGSMSMFTYSEFVNHLKMGNLSKSFDKSYTLGDCGFQYGKVWRDWDGVDQIKTVIESIKNNPQSRRHVITSINPTKDKDLALYWCHSMFQFNCLPIKSIERSKIAVNMGVSIPVERRSPAKWHELFDDNNVPKYKLDCQLYQRSADVFLGVPYNIASYSLLTHIICKIVNMVPGDFIHSFGDVHIYDNHMSQVNEQLNRNPEKLPSLEISDECNDWALIRNTLNFSILDTSDFNLKNYNPQPKIKGKLSTGLK